MNILKSSLLVAVSAFSFTNTWAQDRTTGGGSSPVPMRHSVEATQATGTILKKNLEWDSKIPLNKTYGELTDEQKAELHKMYASLAPGDEPPFPAEGIKPIFNSLKNAQRTLQAHGALDMKVTVGPDGTATKVDDNSTTRSVQMTQRAQRVLMSTKYKPAVCSGAPCTMQYLFRLDLNGG
jgi:hypothetical protein